MSQQPKEFKVGDHVYYPTLGTQVFRLTPRTGAMAKDFPLALEYKNFKYPIAPSGKSAGSEIAQVFHATEENRLNLETLYGVKFDTGPRTSTEKLILAVKQGKPVPAMLKGYARPVFVDGYCKEEGFFVYPDYSGVHEGRIALPGINYHGLQQSETTNEAITVSRTYEAWPSTHV